MAKRKNQTFINGKAKHLRTEGDYMSTLLEAYAEYRQQVDVWTPAGNILLAEAKLPKHAADLKRWNPQPLEIGHQ